MAHETVASGAERNPRDDAPVATAASEEDHSSILQQEAPIRVSELELSQ